MRESTAQKRQKAFRMRAERNSLAQIGKSLQVSSTTLCNWENGWIDSKGSKHKGWKEELSRAWQDQEEQELQCGLLLKKERLKAYDKLVRMVIAKVEEKFPAIKAKTASDMKALLSEVRELSRLIALEKGELSQGGQTLIAVKTDVSLTDLQQRYIDAQHNNQESAG